MRRIAPERPAVVLLHASGSSPRQWDALVERLQPRFRPLAVALRGPEDATSVASTLTRLGGAHLVGHSYGGAIALLAAAQHPGLVHSVSAYEPVLFRALFDDARSVAEMHDVLNVAEWIRAMLARNEPQAAAKGFIEYWSGSDAWRYLPPARQAAIAARMEEVLGNFNTLFNARFDAAGFGRLRLPMLFLAGSQTVASTRRLAILLRDAIPAAMHEVLPGMGHMGPVTHADAVNARIEHFLATCETQTRHSITFLNRGKH